MDLPEFGVRTPIFLQIGVRGFPRIRSCDSLRLVGSSGGISMRPRERRESGEQDLFRSRLDQGINRGHALVKLARTIARGFLGEKNAAVYHHGPGQTPVPTRLMVAPAT